MFTGFVPEYAPTWQLRFTFPRQPLRAIRAVQTNSGNDSWSIHELQILDGGRRLPRDPAWSLTAQPYPWGIENIADNRLITFWTCGDTLHPGQFVQVDLAREQAADSVLIQTAPNQFGIRLELRAARHCQRRAAPGSASRPSHKPPMSRCRPICAVPPPKS